MEPFLYLCLCCLIKFALNPKLICFTSFFCADQSIGFDDHPHSPAVNFDLPSRGVTDLPADTSHDVGSTGDQFGPVASGEALEATTGPSLDETWRSAGADSVEEEEEEEIEADWEARKRRRAEEKARREQEQWEAQQVSCILRHSALVRPKSLLHATDFA